MDTASEPATDTGTAYGFRPGQHDAYLTEVGPGTPCGELMRRYWQPIALSTDANATPMEIRILGEDLVLFRDGNGRPGLLYPRCCHRGTTLYFGRCEADGIRCCYHGWLFSVDGRCIEQPGEPTGSGFKQKVRQPWYPVQDQYGVIWAYMGPPEKKPLLPRYDIFENLRDDESIVADDCGRATGGLAERRFIAPCNWMHNWENVLDPAHVEILHRAFTGPQFQESIPVPDDPPKYAFFADGVQQVSSTRLADGRTRTRQFAVRLPHERCVPPPNDTSGMPGVSFAVPVDDTHYLIVQIRKERAGSSTFRQLVLNGKSWLDLTPAERRATPSDFEAQTGQGPITLHSEEHLGSTDRGVIMVRRKLREQIKRVASGLDPAGVIYDAADQVRSIPAGTYDS